MVDFDNSLKRCPHAPIDNGTGAIRNKWQKQTQKQQLEKLEEFELKSRMRWVDWQLQHVVSAAATFCLLRDPA